MSYCRFSDDNYSSDVYVYDADDGVVIHVARHRFVGGVPAIPSLQDLAEDRVSPEDYLEAYNRQQAFIQQAEVKPIGGKYDGMTVVTHYPEDAVDWLETLVRAGYHVPKRAVEELRDEALLRDAQQDAQDEGVTV